MWSSSWRLVYQFTIHMLSQQPPFITLPTVWSAWMFARSASCFPATSISVLSLLLSASRNCFSSSPTQDMLHNKRSRYACFYWLKIFILFTKQLYYQNVIALLLAWLSGLFMDHVSCLRHWSRHLFKRDKWTMNNPKLWRELRKSLSNPVLPIQNAYGVNIWCPAY